MTKEERVRLLNDAYLHLIARKIIKSQQDIVKDTGFSKSTVSSYFSGAQNPSKNFMKKFIEVYEPNIKQLEENVSNLHAEEKTIIPRLMEQIAAIKAAIGIIMPVLTKLEAKDRSESTAKISMEFAEMIRQETERILSELEVRFPSSSS